MYTIILLLQAQPNWLKLSRTERNTISGESFLSLLENFKEHMSFEYHDSEAFHATFSDFLLIKAADLQKYYFFIEALRDSALLSESYFELKEVVIGIPDGHKIFENHADY